MAKVINIKWETDGYEIDLPNEVTIPDCFMDSGIWFHRGCELKDKFFFRKGAENIGEQ